MYAVKFKHIHSKDWHFASPHIIVSEGDVETKEYPIEAYLCRTLKEAQEIYLHIISRYNGYLKYIKISEMNSWSKYKTEKEVLPGYWREWDG